MANDIAWTQSVIASSPKASEAISKRSALAPPLATNPPCEIKYDKNTGKCSVVTNDDAIDFWNKETVRSVRAGNTLGIAFRNRWASVDVSYIIAQMLKITQEHKLNNPKNILIPLIKEHINNRNGMAEILLEGFDIDGIKELREDSEIKGFVLPVNRNGKLAYNYVYNLQDGDMSIPMSDGTKVWVKIQTPQPAQQPKLEWASGIKVVADKPKNDNEIQLFSKNHGHLTAVRKLMYKGKTYWAKYAKFLRNGNGTKISQKSNEDNLIIPQAEILCDLNKLNINGIPKVGPLLQFANGKKAILFEEFPAGDTLFHRLGSGKISEKEAVAIMIKIANIVRQLHKAGVYHWDIKLENIWITDRDEVILFDFDMAFRTKKEFIERRLFKALSNNYASTNRIKWRQQNGLDAETSTVFLPAPEEVYSLGMVLLEMVQGLDKARSAETPKGYANRRLSYLEASQGLKGILHKALSDGRSEYETADEFLRDLQTYAGIQPESGFEAIDFEGMQIIKDVNEALLKKNINDQGILTVEGVAGTGKNHMCNLIMKYGVGNFASHEIAIMDTDNYLPKMINDGVDNILKDRYGRSIIVEKEHWTDYCQFSEFEEDLASLKKEYRLVVIGGIFVPLFFQKIHLPDPDIRILLKNADKVNRMRVIKRDGYPKRYVDSIEQANKLQGLSKASFDLIVDNSKTTLLGKQLTTHRPSNFSFIMPEIYGRTLNEAAWVITPDTEFETLSKEIEERARSVLNGEIDHMSYELSDVEAVIAGTFSVIRHLFSSGEQSIIVTVRTYEKGVEVVMDAKREKILPSQEAFAEQSLLEPLYAHIPEIVITAPADWYGRTFYKRWQNDWITKKGSRYAFAMPNNIPGIDNLGWRIKEKEDSVAHSVRETVPDQSSSKQPESGAGTIIDLSFPIGDYYVELNELKARHDYMDKLCGDIEKKIEEEIDEKLFNILLSPHKPITGTMAANAVDAIFERIDNKEMAKEFAMIRFKVFADKKNGAIYMELTDNGIGIDTKVMKGWVKGSYKSTKPAEKWPYVIGGMNVEMKDNFSDAAKNNIEISIETKTKDMPALKIVQNQYGQRQMVESNKQDVGTRLTLKSNIALGQSARVSGEDIRTILDKLLPESNDEKNTYTAIPESERIHATNLSDAINFMQAKEEARPLIIAIGTSWIKGYKKDEHLQYDALNPLLSSMAKCDKFSKTKFIVKDDKELLTEIQKVRIGEKGFEGARVIALAGKETVTHDLWELNDDDNVLLGIDNTYLTEDSYIRIMEMLEIAMRFALNIQIQLSSPNMDIQRQGLRCWILTPRAERMDYEKQKLIYELQRFA